MPRPNESAIERQRMREDIAYGKVELIAQQAVRGAFIEALGIEPEVATEHSDDDLREMLLSKIVSEEGKI
ncbi:MAG: hypothetical protein WC498_01655 [Candidatus Saccharimonadales bacterium]